MLFWFKIEIYFIVRVVIVINIYLILFLLKFKRWLLLKRKCFVVFVLKVIKELNWCGSFV